MYLIQLSNLPNIDYSSAHFSFIKHLANVFNQILCTKRLDQHWQNSLSIAKHGHYIQNNLDLASIISKFISMGVYQVAGNSDGHNIKIIFNVCLWFHTITYIKHHLET